MNARRKKGRATPAVSISANVPRSCASIPRSCFCSLLNARVRLVVIMVDAPVVVPPESCRTAVQFLPTGLVV
jgi:DTW domain-containing protein YfiP